MKSCNYVCACPWAARFLFLSFSFPVSLMDYFVVQKKNQHLCQALSGLCLLDSQLFISAPPGTLSYTRWGLLSSDSLTWVYLIDLILEPFCMVSIPSKLFFFFIGLKTACVPRLHPHTLWSISGLMWCFLFTKGTLEGPCVPAGSQSSVHHQEEKEKESLLHILVSQDFDSFPSFTQLGLALYT